MANEKEIHSQMDALIRQMGINPQAVGKPMEKEQIDQLSANLNKSDAEKLRKILGDPEETKRILNTPQAQQLMKLLQEKQQKRGR